MLGKLKKNYFLLISTFLILYFFFNLLDGERGLFSYFKKKEILVNLKIDEANLSFLTRKYFIIQKKIIELALCSQTTSKKFVNIKTEVNDLIKATGFVFFKQILKRFSL